MMTQPTPTITLESETEFVLDYDYGEGRDVWPAMEAKPLSSVTAGQGPEYVIEIDVFDGSHAHGVLLTPEIAMRLAAWLAYRALEGFEYREAMKEMAP